MLMNQGPSKETWRDILGFEKRYQVSTCGRIRSLTRKSGKRTWIAKPIVLHRHNNGYWVVWLRKPGVHKKFFVHRLVARAFLANPQELPIVNHIDRDRQNSHVTNLEWCTLSENTQHWMRHDAEKVKIGVDLSQGQSVQVEVEIDIADIPF